MSIRHTVRRGASGDYFCSCGQTWDYDEGCECPAMATPTAKEWECSSRGVEVPVGYLRKVLVALKHPHDTDNRQAVINQIEHLLAQVAP